MSGKSVQGEAVLHTKHDKMLLEFHSKCSKTVYTYMTGWFPSTQTIIVHGGQVIVYQTHGMDHLHGHGGRHGSQFVIGAEHVGGGQTKNGTNTFSTRHEGILHGFDNEVRFGFGADQGFVQGLFYHGQLGLEVGLQVKVGGGFLVGDGTRRQR